MDESGGWCTIESDPGVFTELIEDLGVKGLMVQEVVSLDESSIATLGEVYGLIFLFKHQKSSNTTISSQAFCPEGMFFAKQVVPNACATQAILSILLNLPATNQPIDIGSTLSELKEFALGLDAESRGFAIGSSDAIKTSHNSFRPHLSLEVGHDESSQGEAFHFVSYVWFQGSVYELDGLQSLPLLVSVCSDRSLWLPLAAAAIQRRIETYGQELRFNLLAIVADDRIGASDESLREITARRARWTLENRRRRHDFVPLGLACLQILAEQGELVKMFRQAKQG